MFVTVSLDTEELTAKLVAAIVMLYVRSCLNSLTVTFIAFELIYIICYFVFLRL